jgi:hypothetical protein
MGSSASSSGSATHPTRLGLIPSYTYFAPYEDVALKRK